MSFKLATIIGAVKRYGLLIVMSFTFFLPACNGETKLVKVKFIDFAPDDGDYNLNWPGPPRRPFTDADKEYYKATIELDQKAPEKFTLVFNTKEAITWWPDPTLGDIMAVFNPGDYKSEPKFWLVCTKGGKVKGNLGKGDDRHANVYVEFSGNAYIEGEIPLSFATVATTYKHEVICK